MADTDRDESHSSRPLGLIPFDPETALGSASQRERLALVLLAPFAVPLLLAGLAVVLVVEGGALLLGKLLGR